VALTSASDNAYENGYKVTHSNQHSSYKAWEAFDHTGDVIGWYSTEGAAVAYNGTTRPGLYSGNTRLATETEEGEWIGLELPEAIKLQSVRMTSQSYSSTGNTVDEFIIYAKKQSGDVWTSLGLFTGVAGAQNSAAGVTVNVDAIDYYKFFNLVVTKRHDVATPNLYGISIRELEYYGTPEYDPEAHGTDVTVKSVANVPNTDWLEVYYDAKETSSYPESGMTVTDLAGTQQNGTFNGGFDPTYKAFTFNGTSQNITTTLSNSGTPSAYAHTFAFWAKPISNLANAIQQAFLQLGTHSSNSCSALRIEESTGLFRWFFHGNDMVYSASHVMIGEWNHIVATYDGGSVRTSRRIWVNGHEIHHISISGTIGALSLSANAPLSIGSQEGGLGASTYFNGSIANFRLFNRALTQDEIYQLYAYQKEDFEHSTNNMTLKAGRLGIGTSEPRAALDVRGDIIGGCPVFFTAYAGNGSNATVTGSTGGTVIIFSNTTVNKGGAYDISNGRCTFPISGYYEIFFRGGTASTVDFHAKIYRNGDAPGTNGWPNHLPRLWDSSDRQFRNAGTIQFFYYFAVGEYIDVRLTNSSVFNADNYNSFSVKYLSN
jgi:hypothetical protein